MTKEFLKLYLWAGYAWLLYLREKYAKLSFENRFKRREFWTP